MTASCSTTVLLPRPDVEYYGGPQLDSLVESSFLWIPMVTTSGELSGSLQSASGSNDAAPTRLLLQTTSRAKQTPTIRR